MMTAELGTYTLRDMDIDALVTSFNTQTNAGRTALTERISNPTTDTTVIEKRIAQLKEIRDRCDLTKIAAARQVLKDTEADVLSVAEAKTDARHTEYYTQILWDTSSRFAEMNTKSWLNELIVFLRTIFLPGLSVLTPLAILLLPVILITVVMKQSFSISEYWKLLTSALKKTLPGPLGKSRFSGRGGIFEVGEQIAHVAVGLGVLVAGVWNQIAAAVTMRKVVADMRRRAAAVRQMCGAIEELSIAMGVAVELPVWPSGDLGLFGAAWNNPALVTDVLKQAGELDMLAALALQMDTCFVEFGDSVLLTDLYHPGTGERRIPNTVQMGAVVSSLDVSANETDVSSEDVSREDVSGEDVSGQDVSGEDVSDEDVLIQRHVLLTGPNRGGKSTLLKSVGVAALMAQTIGIVYAKQAQLPVFHHIITALQPADVIGKMSLFEAEIEFAKSVNARLESASGPMLLIMDEIFHGTNAHDGVEASQVFLDELYRTTAPVYSIISTHYMGLPERYGKSLAQTLCMDASLDPTDPDRLVYTYKLQKGINEFSSVREILRERGLLKAVRSDNEKTTTSGSKE